MTLSDLPGTPSAPASSSTGGHSGHRPHHAAQPHCHRSPGRGDFWRFRARKHPLWATLARRQSKSTPPPRRHLPTTSSWPCPRVRHLPGRARRAVVWRAKAAHCHRPRHLEEPAAAVAGRSHQRAGRRERTHGAGRAGHRHAAPHRAAHHPGHCPPAGHGAKRRPHRGAGAWPHRRARHPRHPDGGPGRVRALAQLQFTA